MSEFGDTLVMLMDDGYNETVSIHMDDTVLDALTNRLIELRGERRIKALLEQP